MNVRDPRETIPSLLKLVRSLEEFGLEGDVIREQLADLFERFQWDAGDEGAPTSPAQGEA